MGSYSSGTWMETSPPTNGTLAAPLSPRQLWSATKEVELTLWRHVTTEERSPSLSSSDGSILKCILIPIKFSKTSNWQNSSKFTQPYLITARQCSYPVPWTCLWKFTPWAKTTSLVCLKPMIRLPPHPPSPSILMVMLSWLQGMLHPPVLSTSITNAPKIMKLRKSSQKVVTIIPMLSPAPALLSATKTETSRCMTTLTAWKHARTSGTS